MNFHDHFRKYFQLVLEFLYPPIKSNLYLRRKAESNFYSLSSCFAKLATGTRSKALLTDIIDQIDYVFHDNELSAINLKKKVI